MRVLAFMEATTVTGPAKNLFEFGSRARRAGVEMAVVRFERPPADSSSFTRAAIDAGLAVRTVRERRAFDLAVLPQIRDIVAAYKPDILQTHNVKSHFVIRCLGLRRCAPWIAFHHGYTYTDFKMRLYNALGRLSLPGAHRVVTVCGAFASDLRRAGVAPERIAVRHNTVKPFIPPAPSEVVAARTLLNIPDNSRVVLCAGRFSREKGHADLIRAIAALSEFADIPEFRLVLAGDGPERPNLERLSDSLRVADRVVFAGHQPDLAPFYAMADVFALPSHSEGSPNVLLEAMSAGLAVAATPVGGVPEIAEDGRTALLVPKGRPEALARAIGSLLLDGGLRARLGSEARGTAGRFSPEAYCDWMLRLYNDVLSGAGMPAVH